MKMSFKRLALPLALALVPPFMAAAPAPVLAKGQAQGLEASALLQQSLQPAGSDGLPPWNHLDALPIGDEPDC